MSMFFEIIIAMILGISAGIFTGLAPGIHINLVSLLLVSSSAYFLGFTSGIVLAVFIIAMAITHTFLDAIPSIYLGAPDSDQVLSALPGHVLLQQGMGYEAVKLTVIGSLLSLIGTVCVVPLLVLVAPWLEAHIKDYIGWILLGIVIFMILRENGLNDKLWSLFVFLLSGVFGLIVLTIPNLEQPLFGMLSGLFGISMLIVSMNQNVSVPEQRFDKKVAVNAWHTFKAVAGAVVSGSVVGYLPGVGPAQAAILGNGIAGNLERNAFLILVGGINTVNMLVSLVTLYALDKARNGAVIAIKQITGQISLNGLVVLVTVALIAGCFATFLTLWISRFFSKIISKVNYKLLSICVISFVSALVFYFSSWLGFFVLVVSTAIGIVPNVKNVKRSHLMGCLLLPVILFFIL